MWVIAFELDTRYRRLEPGPAAAEEEEEEWGRVQRTAEKGGSRKGSVNQTRGIKR